MYEDIADEAMDELMDMVENNQLSDDKCNNFIVDYDLEDEFSHNDIGEIQTIFKDKAKKYLSEKCKGQYIIYCDWCVHICSVKFYEEYLKSLTFFEKC